MKPKYRRTILDGQFSMLVPEAPHEHTDHLPNPADERLILGTKARCSCGDWFTLGVLAYSTVRVWRWVSKRENRRLKRLWSWSG